MTVSAIILGVVLYFALAIYVGKFISIGTISDERDGPL